MPSDLEIGMSGLEGLTAALAGRHGLVACPKMEELVDYLFGLSCRDQEMDGSDPKRLAARRNTGHKLAQRMRQNAEQMLRSLESIYADMHAFANEVQSNPGLLEAIFHIDTGGPESLCLPKEIAILHTCFRQESDDLIEEILAEEPAHPDDRDAPQVPFKRCSAEFWEEVDDRLAAVAALPVRPTLTRGPVPNVVLRSALRGLRSYWTEEVRTPWARSSLRHKEVRDENQTENLIGPCERFVVDALQATGLRFSLAELASTWASIDQKG